MSRTEEYAAAGSSPEFNKQFPRDFKLPQSGPTSPGPYGLPVSPSPHVRGRYFPSEVASPHCVHCKSGSRTHSPQERLPSLSVVTHSRSESEPRAAIPKTNSFRLPLQLSQKLKSSFMHRFNSKSEPKTSRKNTPKAAKIEYEPISPSMDWTEE